MMENTEWLTLRALGEHLMWVAPVGVRELRGWMVCRRVMNNLDGPNTRVDYLRVNPRTGCLTWKKPFREGEHLFATLDAAVKGALEAARGAGTTDRSVCRTSEGQTA